MWGFVLFRYPRAVDISPYPNCDFACSFWFLRSGIGGATSDIAPFSPPFDSLGAVDFVFRLFRGGYRSPRTVRVYTGFVEKPRSRMIVRVGGGGGGMMPELIYFEEIFPLGDVPPRMSVYIRYRGMGLFRTYMTTFALGCCSHFNGDEFETRWGCPRFRYLRKSAFPKMPPHPPPPPPWRGRWRKLNAS